MHRISQSRSPFGPKRKLFNFFLSNVQESLLKRLHRCLVLTGNAFPLLGNALPVYTTSKPIRIEITTGFFAFFCSGIIHPRSSLSTPITREIIGLRRDMGRNFGKIRRSQYGLLAQPTRGNSAKCTQILLASHLE